MSWDLHGTVAGPSLSGGKLTGQEKEYIMRVRTRYARQRHLWFSVWNQPDDKTRRANPSLTTASIPG